MGIDAGWGGPLLLGRRAGDLTWGLSRRDILLARRKASAVVVVVAVAPAKLHAELPTTAPACRTPGTALPVRATLPWIQRKGVCCTGVCGGDKFCRVTCCGVGCGV